MAETDEALMLAFKAGNKRAFDELFRRHERRVLTYMVRAVGNRAIGQEKSQDVWLKVIRASPGYEVRAKFTTWLYAIANNLLTDFYKSKGDDRQEGVEIDDESLAVGLVTPAWCEVPHLVMVGKASDRLRYCLRKLPFEQRQAFLMCEELGMTVPEAADLLAASLEGVKSRLRYARDKLKACIGDVL